MKEFKLNSGSVLKVGHTPFSVSKALYQAVLKELKGLKVNSTDDLALFLKDFVCVGFSSQEIEKALVECFKRCTLNDLKIDDQTFEPDERREDYVPVCVEVVKENILPFMKSLFVESQRLLAMADGIRK